MNQTYVYMICGFIFLCSRVRLCNLGICCHHLILFSNLYGRIFFNIFSISEDSPEVCSNILDMLLTIPLRNCPSPPTSSLLLSTRAHPSTHLPLPAPLCFITCLKYYNKNSLLFYIR